ncbi:hypothetical protein SAMN05421688_1687 [Poseidonocella pacifica]|uniref:Cache domain-containing protein n=1 Tax=Poseidonocella pacifica TaxID=871651 RepID=A0A1I0WRX5_9RHOB|nr:PDC sensor domain-containing protein [Poseidonocella pacifica]SFA91157.1 hypothetical protein SAMN05421688_1687 [Poseidonocella pacifica]
MRAVIVAAIIAATGASVSANEFAPAMQTYLDTEIRGWSDNPLLVEAIKSQNAKTAGYAEATILELDSQWRSEVGSGSSELVNGVLDSEASTYLRDVIERSQGSVTEIFLMDSVGLNVAASGATSDYWQGDEAKHAETYAKGPDAVHFGDVEFDESSQTFQVQISFPVIDPANNEPVGAITVGLNAEALY